MPIIIIDKIVWYKSFCKITKMVFIKVLQDNRQKRPLVLCIILIMYKGRTYVFSNGRITNQHARQERFQSIDDHFTCRSSIPAGQEENPLQVISDVLNRV